jgi:hypothetical protein
MLLTGILLIVGEPVREFTALSFWLKMTLLAIVVAGTAVFGRSFRPSPSTAGEGLASVPEPHFSPAAKAAVVAFIVLWLAVIFLGRAIAYDVEVWGSYSLHAPQ